MNPMICKSCGRKIMTVSDYGQSGECRACYNKRHRSYNKNDYTKEYRKTRRWLNGSESRDDMGPEADIFIKAVNGSARVYSTSNGRLA